MFKARFKLKPALARFILTTIELLCLFTKIKNFSLKIKIVFIKRKMEKKQVLIFMIAVKKLMYKKKINAIKRNLLEMRYRQHQFQRGKYVMRQLNLLQLIFISPPTEKILDAVNAMILNAREQ